MKIPSHRIYSSLAMCYSDHLCIPCRLCMVANSERHLDKYPQLPRMFLKWQLLLSLVSIPNKNKHCLLIFFNSIISTMHMLMYIQFLYIKIYNFRIKIYNFRIKSDKMIKELKKIKWIKKKMHYSSRLICYFFTADGILL